MRRPAVFTTWVGVIGRRGAVPKAQPLQVWIRHRDPLALDDVGVFRGISFLF